MHSAISTNHAGWNRQPAPDRQIVSLPTIPHHVIPIAARGSVSVAPASKKITDETVSFPLPPSSNVVSPQATPLRIIADSHAVCHSRTSTDVGHSTQPTVDRIVSRSRRRGVISTAGRRSDHCPRNRPELSRRSQPMDRVMPSPPTMLTPAIFGSRRRGSSRPPHRQYDVMLLSA